MFSSQACKNDPSKLRWGGVGGHPAHLPLIDPIQYFDEACKERGHYGESPDSEHKAGSEQSSHSAYISVCMTV